jgi:hypothetical protein
MDNLQKAIEYGKGLVISCLKENSTLDNWTLKHLKTLVRVSLYTEFDIDYWETLKMGEKRKLWQAAVESVIKTYYEETGYADTSKTKTPR